MAGFNAPSGMNFVEQQPMPMFSQEGRGSQAPELLSVGPQRAMAGFIRQLPEDSGLLESSNVRTLSAPFKSAMNSNFLKYYYTGIHVPLIFLYSDLIKREKK